MHTTLQLAPLLDNLRDRGMHIPCYVDDPTDTGETISIQELITDSERLAFLIRRVARRMKSENLVAAASLFQKRYAGSLLATVLTPMSTIGVGILADWQKAKIRIVNDLPSGLVLPNNCPVILLSERMQEEYRCHCCLEWRETESEETLRQNVFQAVFHNNLWMMMTKITKLFGLSPKVMWGNIGNYCGFLYEKLDQEPAYQSHANRDRHIIHRELSYDGQSLESTYQVVTFKEVAPTACSRVRSTCCLWYQFPDGGPCITCPRLSKLERVEQLQLQHT
ncbi:IucA/IucC family C-terminal-domain containing protein [Brevibacillus dissolubilis]|uniref:IucA/IucC family C-terminal-domain containing protein n=1 Tax=Brevibacillus dissolubilis TaxID=1844116 RepID=UPI00111673BF|nr:IucA/IucC family C-terminal-domain containing protein [Brevibacillus dissolubilis]